MVETRGMHRRRVQPVDPLSKLPQELYDLVLRGLGNDDLLSLRSTNRANSALCEARFVKVFWSTHYVRLTRRSMAKLKWVPKRLLPAIDELVLELSHFPSQINVTDRETWWFLKECLGVWAGDDMLEISTKMPILDTGLKQLGHVGTVTLCGDIDNERLVEIVDSELLCGRDVAEQAATALARTTEHWENVFRVKAFLWSMRRTGFTCNKLNLDRISPAVLRLSLGQDFEPSRAALSKLKTSLERTHTIELRPIWNTWEAANHDVQSMDSSSLGWETSYMTKKVFRPRTIATFLNCATNVKNLTLELEICEGTLADASDRPEEAFHNGDQTQLMWEVNEFFSQLKSFDKLTHLLVESWYISINLVGFCRFLGKNLQLQEVALEGLNSVSGEWDPVFTVFQYMDDLEKLTIEGLIMTDEKGRPWKLLMKKEATEGGLLLDVSKSNSIVLRGKGLVSRMLARHKEVFEYEPDW